MFDRDDWAVVLGASSGFGLATATRLAEAGMSLCLVHRDRRATLRAVEPHFERMRAGGGTVLTFNADALAEERRSAVIAALCDALGRSGRVKVLLHSIAFGSLKPLVQAPAHTNDAASELAKALGLEADAVTEAAAHLLAAGVDGVSALAPPPLYPETPLGADELARTIHCMGTSLLEWVQALHEQKLFAPDVRVFGLTSEGNAVSWPGYAAVAAAKVALESMARAIATEFGPHGIRCNVLQPGVTRTPALAAIPGSDRLAANARQRNPMGRLTTPEDVAGLVYLLCQPEAAWVNGALIRVDGGEHISGASA